MCAATTAAAVVVVNVVVALVWTTAVRFADDLNVGVDVFATTVFLVELVCSTAGEFWARLFLFESELWFAFSAAFKSATLNLGFALGLLGSPGGKMGRKRP